MSDRANDLLYSCDSRQELCERIASLEDLAEDAIAVVIGWGARINELCGHAQTDYDCYPMATAKGLVDRMHGLGFGFGDARGRDEA